MASPIEYATTSVDVPGAIRWEREGDGPTLVATVTIPPPPVWWDAFGLTVGIAFLSGLMLLSGALLYHSLATSRRVEWIGTTLGTFALLALSSALLRALRLLLNAPRMARVPTVICASRAGLLITSAQTGLVRQYHIPAERIAALAARRGPPTATLKRTVRIWVEMYDGLEMFQFLTRERGVAERLAAMFDDVLARPPGNASGLVPWIGWTPI